MKFEIKRIIPRLAAVIFITLFMLSCLGASNQEPEVHVGRDIFVTPGMLVTLSGSASDPDGDMLNCWWEYRYFSGGPLSDMITVRGTTLEFVADEDDHALYYICKFNAEELYTDDKFVASVQCIVYVSDYVLNAGTNQIAHGGDFVELQGSISNVTDYYWEQTAGAVAVLSGTNTLTPTFTAPMAEGDLIFYLVGNIANFPFSNSVVVKLVNIEPEVYIGADQNVTSGDTVTLTANPADSDGDDLYYLWTQTSGITVTLNGANTLNPTFTAPSTGGDLVFQLIVSDGIESNSDTLTVSVTEQPPIIDLFEEVNAGSITGTEVGGADMADIDGDGDLDYVLMGRTNGGNSATMIYRNNGNFSFTEINAGSIPGGDYADINFGDIDGDNDPDIIIATGNGSRIYRNNGSGDFSEINPGSLQTMINSQLEIFDMNGDNHLDVIISGYHDGIAMTYLYVNDGTGNFTKSTNLEGMQYPLIAYGDFDGDNDNDIIISGVTKDHGTLTKILQNNGSGYFTEINSGTIDGAIDGGSDLCDLDGDGDLDYVIVGSTMAKVYQNNGSGAFTEINTGCLAGCSDAEIDTGDLDGDGDIDVIITGQIGNTFLGQSYLNDGNGDFELLNSTALQGVRRGDVVIGDLNADNKLDVIISGRYYNANTSSEALFAGIYRNIK